MFRRFLIWLNALGDTAAERNNTARERDRYHAEVSAHIATKRQLATAREEVVHLTREAERLTAEIEGRREFWSTPLRIVKGGRS